MTRSGLEYNDRNPVWPRFSVADFVDAYGPDFDGHTLSTSLKSIVGNSNAMVWRSLPMSQGLFETSIHS
jgi:hypothetical protein